MWCRLRWVSPPDTGGFRVGATVNSIFEAILRRDRMLVAVALAVLVALCWAYLLAGAGMSMHEMDGMLMPMRMEPWTLHYAVIVFVMWSVMMAAMMLPSAAPMILLYATIARRPGQARGEMKTASFVGGYIVVWALFSAAAVALQFRLEQAALLSSMMEMTSIALAGAILILAGLYQWTPLKRACLRRCRSPLDFLMTEWREGGVGAFVMGLRHGLYCLGCCWLLMLLLFVGGIMNLVWIAALAVFVLIEKIAPAGYWIGRAAGLALVVWGGATLTALWQ
jgi:predicted metal-binding membrane protein